MVENNITTSILVTGLSVITAALFYNFGYLVLPETGAITSSMYNPEELKQISIKFFFISGISFVVGIISLSAVFVKEKTLIVNVALSSLLIIKVYGWFVFSSYFYAVVE
jgi:PhoPQ-activated pathogenicity-related protein